MSKTGIYRGEGEYPYVALINNTETAAYSKIKRIFDSLQEAITDNDSTDIEPEPLEGYLLPYEFLDLEYRHYVPES